MHIDKYILNQQTITIAKDHLVVVLASDGELYMSISSVCNALGICTSNQIRQIQRIRILAQGLCRLALKTQNRKQWTNCLLLTLIPEWLKIIQKYTLPIQVNQKLMIYDRELVDFVNTAFAHIHQTINTQNQCVVSGTRSTKQLPMPINEELLASRQVVFATLPQQNVTSFLLVTNSNEDTAFRESCLAKKQDWTITETPYYTASNQIQIYLSHPDHRLDPIIALQRIEQMGLSTVSTARIAFGLWYNQLKNKRISENDAAALSIEEILEWRGIQKHSWAASPGSSVRITGNYESKFLEQVCRDFFSLQQCHLYRKWTVLEKGATQHFTTIDPYMSVDIVSKGNLSSPSQKVEGFLVSPGNWFTSYYRQSFHKLAILDQRIFTLTPRYDSLAIRIALYLIERWHAHSLSATPGETENDPFQPYRKPIMMSDLLRSSTIEIDRVNLTCRFVGMIESALIKLFDRHILGFEPECLSRYNKFGQWGEKWLSSLWYLLPNLEVVDEYQHLTTNNIPDYQQNIIKREIDPYYIVRAVDNF